MDFTNYKEDHIKPWSAGAAHPFKGKTIEDIVPFGRWWRKGWIIYFTDGSWFTCSMGSAQVIRANRPE